MKPIFNDDFTDEVLNQKGRVLVDFNASWCGPCQMVGVMLEELSEKFNIVSVDIDENPKLAEEYKVSSIPCLVLFENGKEIKRSIGVRSNKFLEKWLSK